jgi:hypothetical protein
VVDVTSSAEERGGRDIEHVQERREAGGLMGSWRAAIGLAAAAARAEGRLAMKGPTADTRPAWRGLAPLSGLPDSVGHATFVVPARREQVGDPVPLETEQQSRDAPHTCHLLG